MPAKIKRLELRNFRRFDRFDLSARSHNLIVGSNNSGKSSILDSLRIVSDVLRHARHRNPTIKEIDLVGVCAAYSLPTSALSVPISNVATNYSDDPAVVAVILDNGNTLEILLNPASGVNAHLLTTGHLPRTASAFVKEFPLHLVVVPPMAPLEEDEPFVREETVRRNQTTRLASRNFRNIWLNAARKDFERFKLIIEDTWPDITIEKPNVVRLDDNKAYVRMMYSERRIPRELYWSGYGFQIWLQMIFQLGRGDVSSILVLDEPDVYLHPDLQRRLYKIVTSQFGQSFIATHSTEILNEANPGDVFLVRQGASTAQRITSEEGYREAYSYLGSSENAEFARLARARRIVFFEGKDRRLMRRFAAAARLKGVLDDPDTVFLQAGGFEQWRRVKEVNWTLQSVFGLRARVASVFDRDYRCDDEVDEFVSDMNSDELLCFVLGRKEIENYALEINPLHTAIVKRVEKRGGVIRTNTIDKLISSITESMLRKTRARIVTEFVRYNQERRPGIDQTTLTEEIMEKFDSMWGTVPGRLSAISGKEFLSSLSAELQRRYKTSLTIFQILDEFDAKTVDPVFGAQLLKLNEFLSRPLE